MKKEQKMLAVAGLVHAPWNPRTEAELDAGHPEMVKLIASVRELGVIQPVAVWGDADPKMVIAGNRRLAAALAVGVKKIPVFEFTGISEAQAREITRVENEVRIGIDPLKDSELIGSMISLGYDQKEIAAHFGVSEAMICRRAKLIGLLPEIREIAEKSGNFATHCLEQIALYPVEIQRECLADVSRNSKRTGSTVHWDDLRYCFNREAMDLNEAKFDTKPCMKCAKRTGSQPDLWGDLEDGDKLGRCLDGKCFLCMMRKRNESLARDAAGKKAAVLICADDDPHKVYLNNIPEWCADMFGEKQTNRRKVAWWSWEEWSDKITVKFGPTLEEWQNRDLERRAAEDAEKAKRENESPEEKAKREAADAEKKRIHEEGYKLDRAVEDRAENIGGLFTGEEEADVAKLVKSCIFGKAFKGKGADLLARAMAYALCDYSLDDDVRIGIVEAFPAFAKKMKVKADLLKEYHAAVKSLADFEADHPDWK